MKKRYQRRPASEYRCLCGNQAVKWSNGFACQRCIDIESNKSFGRDVCGVRPTHETNWAAEVV